MLGLLLKVYLALVFAVETVKLVHFLYRESHQDKSTPVFLPLWKLISKRDNQARYVLPRRVVFCARDKCGIFDDYAAQDFAAIQRDIRLTAKQMRQQGRPVAYFVAKEFSVALTCLAFGVLFSKVRMVLKRIQSE